MSKANTTSNTSRRGLLAASGIGAALASVGVAAPASAAQPDAALFAACAQAVAIWDEYNAMPPGQSEEWVDEIAGRMTDAADAVADLPARTRLGCKAKARILILEMEKEPSGTTDRLAWRLAHDVLLGAMA